jgi:hypothetical protein
MTRLAGPRAGGLLVVVALALAAVVVPASPSGAEVTNPCKVLKRSELQYALGATVAPGRIAPSTSASRQCEYQVAADQDRPLGTIVVLVRNTGAEKRFRELARRASSEMVDGLADAIWSPNRRAIDVLAGDTLLGIQGNFLRADALPLAFSDVEVPLTALARVGAQRL